MARKAVLAYCADRASDDGRGIWASKQSIADEIECDRSTVIRTVNALIKEGILIQTGTRPCQGGVTIEYSMNIDAIEALPKVKDEKTSRSAPPVAPRHQSQPATSSSGTVPPKPSLNRKVSEANASSTKRATKDKGSRIPNDWKPTRQMPDDVLGLIAQWPPGRFDRELAGFRDYWLTRVRDAARTDWDRTLWNRIRDVHDRVMRDGRYDRPRTNSLRGTRPDPALDMLRQAQAELAAGSYQDPDRPAWPSLPSFGPS